VTPTKSEIIYMVREFISELTDDQRLEFFGEITEGYCVHCGTNNPNCQCWNDE